MNDDIYDATIIHEPAQDDVRIDGETRCPGCDEPLFPDFSDAVLDEALDARIVAPVDCPECGANLEFIVEPTPTPEVGLGLWLVPE